MRFCPKHILFALFICAFLGLSLAKVSVYAESAQDQLKKAQEQYESTTKKLADTRKKIESTNSKIQGYLSQLNVTQQEITDLQKDIDDTKKELDVINENLVDRKGKLAEKTKTRNLVLRNYVKRASLTDIELFFDGVGLNGFQTLTLNQTFNKQISENALAIMNLLNSEISTFEADKKEAEQLKIELETNQTNLITLKNSLDNQKKLAEGEVSNLKGDEAKLVEKLEQIQQTILSLKQSTEGGSVGDYESPTAKTPDPPFTPAFAFFSYGAYTHYNGMSQYGAKGRADKGDDYKEILSFYYKSGTEKKSDFPSKINVQGSGEIDFQYYLYGIAEMPTDWPIEALKAQAVAARTYAYKSSKPICITQSCQVFSKSKADKVKNGDYKNWKKAVDDTSKEILKGASTSQYSSTTGGYINNVGWDISGKWPGDAYEKKAGSPWFYKAWYTKSYSDGNTCGHSHPWLTEKEMADMLNSYIVYKKGSSSEKSHISPTTTSCWGGDPYSYDEMAEKADKYGEKYSSVSSVDVDISNGGYTSTLTFSTDKGSVSVEGPTFKTVFNLRSPGYVAIRSRLYDVEKRN